MRYESEERVLRSAESRSEEELHFGLGRRRVACFALLLRLVCVFVCWLAFGRLRPILG